MSVITVEGVDEIGSRTVLAYPTSLKDAKSFVRRYVSNGDAGNWDLIEIVQHETRVLDYWCREEAEEDVSSPW